MEHCISDAAGFLGGGGSTPSPTPSLTLPGYYYLNGTFNGVVNPVVYVQSNEDGEVEVLVCYTELDTETNEQYYYRGLLNQDGVMVVGWRSDAVNDTDTIAIGGAAETIINDRYNLNAFYIDWITPDIAGREISAL